MGDSHRRVPRTRTHDGPQILDSRADPTAARHAPGDARDPDLANGRRLRDRGGGQFRRRGRRRRHRCGALRMIYTAFVNRDVINSVIDRFGAYFVPAFVSPDVASGILNLVHTSRYLHSFRPFAVRGNSRRSTGSSFWARSLGTEQQNIYLREEGRTIEQLIHPSMTASKSIGFGIASTKLHLRTC